MVESSPQQIDRRQAVRRITALVGGTLSAPTLAGLLGGCQTPAPGVEYAPRTLSGARLRRVETIAELIIPATDTPGASAARVHDYVDMMLTEFFSAAARERFLAQLDRLDDAARSLTGTGFDGATAGGRTRLLAALDAEAFPDPGSAADQPAIAAARLVPGDPPFMRTMKELTVSGYYTSRIGQTVELHLPPFSRYRGDVPFSEIGRSWA